MTDKKTTRDKMTECYECKFKRDVRGSTKITCTNPDPNMQGHEYGIYHGHYCYPIFFHPVWKEDLCNNFEQKEVTPEKVAKSKGIVTEKSAVVPDNDKEHDEMQSTSVSRPTVYDGGENDPRSEEEKKETRNNNHDDNIMTDAVKSYSVETNEMLSHIHEDDRERFELEIEKEKETK